MELSLVLALCPCKKRVVTIASRVISFYRNEDFFTHIQPKWQEKSIG